MRPAVVDAVDEDAVHAAWEERAVLEQERAGVDDGAPRLADAPGLGEAPRRQAAEGVGEGIVGECCHFRRRRLHGGGWMLHCFVMSGMQRLFHQTSGA